MTDPEDLLDIAMKVASLDHTEAARRTAVNRAYYAAYHCVSSHSVAKGYNAASDKGRRHWGFIQHLKSSADKEARYLGKILHGLYSRRLVADYELGVAVNNSEMSASIEDAKAILDTCL